MLRKNLFVLSAIALSGGVIASSATAEACGYNVGYIPMPAYYVPVYQGLNPVQRCQVQRIVAANAPKKSHTPSRSKSGGSRGVIDILIKVRDPKTGKVTKGKTKARVSGGKVVAVKSGKKWIPAREGKKGRLVLKSGHQAMYKTARGRLKSRTRRTKYVPTRLRGKSCMRNKRCSRKVKRYIRKHSRKSRYIPTRSKR